MRPVNVHELLERARGYGDQVGDFARECVRIHAVLGRAAYDAPALPIEAEYVYSAMALILNLSAKNGWHLGVALMHAEVPDRPRRPLDYVAEAHAMIALAYGAVVTTPEEKGAAPTFLALAFRLLLSLCEVSGFEPQEGLTRWYTAGDFAPEPLSP